jgi:hypothetical protein
MKKRKTFRWRTEGKEKEEKEEECIVGMKMRREPDNKEGKDV